jgi:hypothetical protein
LLLSWISPSSCWMSQCSELCFGSLPPLCIVANLKNCERTQSKQNLCTTAWELVEMTLMLLFSSSQSIKYSTPHHHCCHHSSHGHSQMSTPPVLIACSHPCRCQPLPRCCRPPPPTAAATVICSRASKCLGRRIRVQQSSPLKFLLADLLQGLP